MALAARQPELHGWASLAYYMVLTKHTSAPRCYLRFPACSLAVWCQVQRPTHCLAVQLGWQLTPFFLSLPVLVPLQFWLVLHEGFLFVLPLCSSKAFFNIIDYFFCGPFNQFLLQSIEVECFNICICFF